MFNAVGPVSSIHVCRDAVTRRSLGYAYVNFQSQADAEKALDGMNYTPIRGRPCRIMWSQRDPALRKSQSNNVFIKNLNPTIDNQMLFDTFSMFGNILSCKVVTDRATGASKGFGFVHFEFPEAADEAISKINGMVIADKEVYVAKLIKRQERPSIDAWTNCYVKGIPLHWDDDRLKLEFETHGPISSCVVMKTPEGGSKGFGFVDFNDHESAAACVEAMNGKRFATELGEKAIAEGGSLDEDEPAAAESKTTTTEGGDDDDDDAAVEKSTSEKPKKTTTLFVARAQKKSERERELTSKFEKLSEERAAKYQNINLFVKNLDESIGDDELREAFSPFGTITSAKIMRDTTDHSSGETDAEGNVVFPSKGFGFVCFSSPEEASLAVTEMNGKMIGNKPIYVALAQRKEARRQQLEVRHNQRNNLARGMPLPNPMGFPGAAQMFYGQAPGRGGFAQPQFAANGMQMMGGRPIQPQQGGRQPQMQQQQQFRGGNAPYAEGGRAAANRRPRQAGGVAGRPAGAQGARGVAVKQSRPQAPEPLTAAALANATEEQQKNMIGERLYPLIQRSQPELAGKITGMLLEMDNPELLHLLESPDALNAKVSEAIHVLEAHSQKQQA